MTSRILIIRAGALGDVVLALPALRALRACYPSAFIQVVGYPEVWELARPLIDHIASIDSPLYAGLFSPSAPTQELKQWLAGFDLAIAWTARDLTPAFRAAGIPTVISASPYPPPEVHAADWLCTTLEPLTPDPSPSGGEGSQVRYSPSLTPGHPQWVPGVPLRPTVGTGLQRGLDKVGVRGSILLHPGAGALWKRWPAERFAQLADELIRSGHRVLLVEGPADAEAVDQVQQHAAGQLAVLRDLPLQQLAAVLARAALFVGNDSGVTHLAAAAGTPTIALFGPTDPASWAPRSAAGRPVTVLRSCSRRAAYQGQVRVCHDPACMDGISIEAVLAAARTMLTAADTC